MSSRTIPNTKEDALLVIAVNGDGSAIASNGTFSPVSGTTSIRTNVASSASSVTLLSSNSSRKSASIANESTAILYVLYGNSAAASSTNYTYVLQPLASGIPSVLSVQPNEYNGIITGIWASANGFARVTEVT